LSIDQCEREIHTDYTTILTILTHTTQTTTPINTQHTTTPMPTTTTPRPAADFGEGEAAEDFAEGAWPTMLETLELPPYTDAFGSPLLQYTIRMVQQGRWSLHAPKLVSPTWVSRPPHLRFEPTSWLTHPTRFLHPNWGFTPPHVRVAQVSRACTHRCRNMVWTLARSDFADSGDLDSCQSVTCKTLRSVMCKVVRSMTCKVVRSVTYIVVRSVIVRSVTCKILRFSFHVLTQTFVSAGVVFRSPKVDLLIVLMPSLVNHSQNVRPRLSRCRC
jgi:hypothetical protein